MTIRNRSILTALDGGKALVEALESVQQQIATPNWVTVAEGGNEALKYLANTTFVGIWSTQTNSYGRLRYLRLARTTICYQYVFSSYTLTGNPARASIFLPAGMTIPVSPAGAGVPIAMGPAQLVNDGNALAPTIAAYTLAPNDALTNQIALLRSDGQTLTGNTTISMYGHIIVDVQGLT